MRVNIDLLGLPGAEYCDRDGVKGVFVPEEPNFEYQPGKKKGKKSDPSRAVVVAKPVRAKDANYDFVAAPSIPRKYYDAYMANPKFVNRRRRFLFIYGKNADAAKSASVSTPADFESMLDD